VSSRTGLTGAGVTLLVAALAVALAACGGGSSSASSTPSPTSTSAAGGIGARLGTLTGYLTEVQPIASRVGTTLSSLPGAVKGLTSKPGPSWSTAGDKLDTAAQQLGAEADDLAALTPPAGLQQVQDEAVQGLRKAESAVSKAAGRLHKRQATASANKAKIQSALDQLKADLTTVTQGLLSGIKGAIASPQATPSP